MTTPTCIACGCPLHESPTPEDVSDTIALFDEKKYQPLWIGHKPYACPKHGCILTEQRNGLYFYSIGGAFFDLREAIDSVAFTLKEYLMPDEDQAALTEYMQWMMRAL